MSKDRLDVMVLPEEQCSSVSNDAAGWAELVEQLRGSSIAAIGIEASGGYERGVMRALLAVDLPVRQVNPFKLRQFARASGVLAKNDPLDARMIASFVTIMPTRPAQRQAPAAERLTEMLAVIVPFDSSSSAFASSTENCSGSGSAQLLLVHPGPAISTGAGPVGLRCRA
jgi:transposase